MARRTCASSPEAPSAALTGDAHRDLRTRQVREPGSSGAVARLTTALLRNATRVARRAAEFHPPLIAATPARHRGDQPAPSLTRRLAEA
ncbi:MAG TPA: hypothetical protein VLH10_04335 [Yinghuangia sp.]|uniref:hypothetical protein n=1 Tax=Yinghuangia sp. YIM S10712 TaxID=3436930 RepID=UPI002D036D61|nr:hypothetical protein [Yinghuangia sp.]